MPYNYKKLLGRIVEVCGTQASFADRMGLSERSVSLKLNGQRPWKQLEISKACQVLDIANTAHERDRKEVNRMFPNLWVQMKRNHCTLQILAERIGVSYASLRNKMSGRNQFTLREMRAIQRIFADCSLDYLFAECSIKD